MTQANLAVTLAEFVGPDVLQVTELPRPSPGAGEVIVRVAAVNHADTKMRTGTQVAQMTDLGPPYLAGMEFSSPVHSRGNAASGLTVDQPIMGLVNRVAPIDDRGHAGEPDRGARRLAWPYRPDLRGVAPIGPTPWPSTRSVSSERPWTCRKPSASVRFRGKPIGQY